MSILVFWFLGQLCVLKKEQNIWKTLQWEPHVISENVLSEEKKENFILYFNSTWEVFVQGRSLLVHEIYLYPPLPPSTIFRITRCSYTLQFKTAPYGTATVNLHNYGNQSKGQKKNSAVL